MQVSFNLTRADFIALLLVQSKQDTKRTFVLARVVLPALLGLSGLANLFISGTIHISQCYSVALFWIILALLSAASDELECRRVLKARNFNPYVEVELRSSGAYAHSAMGESFWPWTNITEVRSTPGHIFPLITKERGIIVPRCAFSSVGEAEQFLQFAETLWLEVRPKKNSGPLLASPH